jgi:hypothetical protein
MNTPAPPAHLPPDWEEILSPSPEVMDSNLPAPASLTEEEVKEFQDDFDKYLGIRGRGRPRTGRSTVKGLLDMNYRHEQLANWLLLNPDKNLKECAAHFNYAIGTVRYIVNTDAFKALLESKQKDVFLAVTQSVPQKLAALADIAIEKVTDHLVASEDPGFALDVFDKTLHRLGYAPQKSSGGPAPQVNATFVVSAADLSSARGLIVDSSSQSEVGLSLPAAPVCPEVETLPGSETTGS